MASEVQAFIALYDRLGFNLVPVDDCKRPAVEWKRFQSESSKQYWSEWFTVRKLNPAAVTGKASGNLVVVDFEDEQLFRETFDEKILSQTLVVKTPHGGVHVYFRAGEEVKREVRVCGLPVDFLGEVGIVVLPPAKVDHGKCDRSKCDRIGAGYYTIVSTVAEVAEVPSLDPVRSRLKFVSRSDDMCFDIEADGVKVPARVSADETGSFITEAPPVDLKLLQDPPKRFYFSDRVSAHDAAHSFAVEARKRHGLTAEGEEHVFVSAAEMLEKILELQKIPDQTPEILSHLSEIEDPRHVWKPVIVEATVSSTCLTYSVPAEIEYSYIEREGGKVSDVTRIPFDRILSIVHVSENMKLAAIQRMFRLPKNAAVKPASFYTVYRLNVRQPVRRLHGGGKVFDEHEKEYKSYEVYIVSERPLDLPPASNVILTGKPVPNPWNQMTSFIAYDVKKVDEVQNFSIEKLDMLKKVFEGKTVGERVEWILSNFERFSKIVKRRNLALAGLLTFFTPLYVEVDGVVRRGWGITVIVGDTTTGKSETVRNLILLLKAGLMVTAETASAAGLAGAAVSSEAGAWFVDWGFLVLQDRRLLAVDGFHRLNPYDIASFAESERTGVVSISKAAKGSAYARTRQIRIANAVDPEAGRSVTKPLSGFLYRVQALSTFMDAVSVARTDLAVFSSSDDVRIEEICVSKTESHDPLLENLGDALRWCWSGKAEPVFSPDAVEELVKASTELYRRFYVKDIPLVNEDIKWKIARLSAALAFMTLSTEDYSTVTVSKEHVEYIASFVNQEYSRAGLSAIAETRSSEALSAEDGKTLIQSTAAELSNKVPAETVVKALTLILERGRSTKSELAQTFSLSDHGQMRPLVAVLAQKNLVRVTNRGIYPTQTLIQAYHVTNGFREVVSDAQQ